LEKKKGEFGLICFAKHHPMLQKSTLKFLKELAENNHKPWFDENKEAYQKAKGDFEVFVKELLEKLSVLEPEFKTYQAKDCIFRIFRDVRFAKDKSPYKPNFGAYFSKGGKKSNAAGYYIHVQPGGKCFLAGGVWMPEAAALKAIRQEIDYNFEAFSKIIHQKEFKKLFPKLEGEALKTVPQGYAADNPAIEFLKMKSFVVMYYFPDKNLTAEGFAGQCFETYKAMQPLVDFLNSSL
jgi:uncharacterized protein (TIGR02453 family)